MISRYFALLLLVACGQPAPPASQTDPAPAAVAAVTPETTTAEQRARFRAFADELRERGIVDAVGVEALDQALAQGRVHSLLDIVPYCQHARVIRLADYAHLEGDSRAYLEAIFTDVASVMPELAFTGFHGCAEADGCGGAPDAAFSWVAGLTHDGHDYGRYMNGLDEATAVFNEILDDRKSPYRLHRFYRERPVSADGTFPDGDFAAFGVVALSEPQATGLHYAGEASQHIAGAHYADYVTPAHIHRGIAEYRRLGLLDHLTEAQIETATERALAEGYTNFNEVFALFPGVVYHVNWDAMLKDAQPYRRAIEGLAAISAGRFPPTRVVDTSVFPEDQDETTFTLSFALKGKTYKTRLGGEYPATEYDVMAKKTIALANRALAAAGARGRFHEIFMTRQLELDAHLWSYVFLTDGQRAALEKSHLLSFAIPEEELEHEDDYTRANYAAEVHGTWEPFYTDEAAATEDAGAARAPRQPRREATSLDAALADPASVESLVLTGRGLEQLPPEIGSLSNLRWLYLQDNKLTTLPASIGNLRKLEYVNLDNNRLTTLPPEIGNLTALTKIVASRNAIESLPPEIGNLAALSELFLYDNALSALPDSFTRLTALDWLNLSNNRLTALPDDIGALAELRWLNLRGNRLERLPASFWTLLNLDRPDLDGNRFDERRRAAIERKLAHHALVNRWTRPIPKQKK